MTALLGVGRAPSARDRLRHVRDYTCYYGAGRVPDLAKFDLAILETRQHTPEDVAKLRSAGTIVIGYVSVGQAHALEVGDGRGPDGMASWYLDQLTETADGLVPGPDGQPDRDPEWQSYWVDLAAPEWQRKLDADVARVLTIWHCDGVFLDALLFDDAYPAAFREREVPERLAQWLLRARRRHPRAVFIANNGWAYLDRLRPLVDGVMVEDFTGRYALPTDEARAASDGIAQRLLDARAADPRRPLTVFALDYAVPSDVSLIHEARTRAARYGFLHTVSNKNLEGIELFVLSTVNPAQQFQAARRGDGVVLSWEANRLHCQEAGVDRFVLKRSEMSITTHEDWAAAELVTDDLDPQHPYYVDERVPSAVGWYALGAVQTSGVELVGRLRARVSSDAAGER
jgi:endo-alpha-1,4-polygalactosaminidase (GH114 family)